MARGGINKALVKQAHESLLAKGQNPSIDAIRVELGNTGSKSTIHRYLKELEEQSTATLNEEALLSQPIQALVKRLASSLKEEAQATIDESKQRSDEQVRTLNCRMAELQAVLTETEQALAQCQQALNTANSEIDKQKETKAILRAEVMDAAQANAQLSAVLEQKQAQIDSLEEKHAHNRDAMAHYREAVKEQREQDQRNQAQHVQQLQSEIRALSQTVAVRQTEFTELNKENGRLAAECLASQRAAVASEASYSATHQKLQKEVEQLTLTTNAQQLQLGQMQAQSAELGSANSTIAALQSENMAQKTQLISLEAEISVKTDMIDKLISEKHKAKKSDELIAKGLGQQNKVASGDSGLDKNLET